MKKGFTILFFLITENLFAQAPITYYTDFEQSLPPNFPLVIHDTAGNLWQIGSPMKTVFNSAASGSRVLVTDTIHSYPPNNHSYFDILIDTGRCWSISFDEWYDTQEKHAGGAILVSIDDGKTFQNFININFIDSNYVSGNQNFYNASDTLFNGSAAFQGNSNGWVNTSFYICGLAETPSLENEHLIFRFDFVSDSSRTVGDGWMIDNLEVVESFPSGIQNVKSEDNTLSVFPNPVQQNATVFFQPKQKEFVDISLYDLSGRKILSLAHENFFPGNQQIDLPMKNLAAGIYFLKHETADAVQSMKIVKQ